MEGLKTDAVLMLQYLFPGLLAAWVYYACTAFRRPDATERVIQALIFTGIVQALVFIEQGIALWIGRWILVGPWTDRSSIVAAALTAVGFGLLAVQCTTRDWVFNFLRRLRLTKQMAYPTEWFGAFADGARYVVLHLKDDRRLYGWPTEWPSSALSGHFRVQQAMWLKGDTGGAEIELPTVWAVLINVEDVRWVEFMRRDGDPNDTQRTYPSTELPARSIAQRQRKSSADTSAATAATAATAG